MTTTGVFHGSPNKFSYFDDSRPRSVGHHFGDIDQALWRIQGIGYIYQVEIRCDRPLIVDEDFGWEHPIWTLKKLFDYPEVVSFDELVAFIEYVESKVGDLSVYLEMVPDVKRAEANLMIVQFLEAKGYDGIIYPNTNEPRDHVEREAFCIFRGRQAKILNITQVPELAAS